MLISLTNRLVFMSLLTKAAAEVCVAQTPIFIAPTITSGEFAFSLK